MGIRRISIGRGGEPVPAGSGGAHRPTSLEWNRQAVENIRAAGYDDFNVDVMYGLARQMGFGGGNPAPRFLDLAPEHIALYQMRYKGTRIAHQATGIAWAQICEQAALAKQMLAEAGYWATPGKTPSGRRPRPGYVRLPDRPGDLRPRPTWGWGWAGADSHAHIAFLQSGTASERGLAPGSMWRRGTCPFRISTT